MKLMVIDGNSIVNRAYYGIRPLSTRDGLYTHAIYGFLTTLQRLLDEEQRSDSHLASSQVQLRLLRQLKRYV